MNDSHWMFCMFIMAMHKQSPDKNKSWIITLLMKYPVDSVDCLRWYWPCCHRTTLHHSVKNKTICLKISWVLFTVVAFYYAPRPMKFTKYCLIPLIHRGCDLCDSLLQPQNWPGHRWRQKGGQTVVLVVQGWYTGCSDITMDYMVTVKF